MLAQLVCLDRRYQRMNCFNIRELQTLLKNRYHPELLDETLHTEFLSQTTLSTRFKLLDLNNITPRMSIFKEYSLLSNETSNTLDTFNVSSMENSSSVVGSRYALTDYIETSFSPVSSYYSIFHQFGLTHTVKPAVVDTPRLENTVNTYSDFSFTINQFPLSSVLSSALRGLFYQPLKTF